MGRMSPSHADRVTTIIPAPVHNSAHSMAVHRRKYARTMPVAMIAGLFDFLALAISFHPRRPVWPSAYF